MTSSPGEKTDKYIRLMMSKKHIPGLSVVILKKGQILKIQSYGLANIETRSPATAQTVYKLGSLSKQFIAAAVMLLEQSGKVNLDSPINAYLDSLPSAWQGIRVRNLLTHTSGLVRDAPDFDPLKVRSLNEDIKAIYLLPLDFAPGAQWDYSNMNYYVLAAIIEKVTGANWAVWISKHVFDPSGMNQTRTCSIIDLIPHRADGYERTSAGWKNAEVWLALRPSGAFLSSIADLAKWDCMFYSHTFLTETSKKQMWTAGKLNDGKNAHYGLGWFIDSVNNHLRVHHDGGVPGFRSDFERYPDDQFSVIVLTNVGSANAERMAQNIAGFYMPALKPLAAIALPDKEPEITIRVKKFISKLQQQSTIDTSTLSTDIAKNYTKSRARTLADAISGKIYFITLIGRREGNGRRTYRYRLDYGYDYTDLIIQFDSGNKIIGYGIDD
ncbi:MAG TPA: serine hydrolase domain-containing protein [Mucilaginibacter sp.]|nr:serine hydrolase domain-containing protein [Mucilaginibacter sp.]